VPTIAAGTFSTFRDLESLVVFSFAPDLFHFRNRIHFSISAYPSGVGFRRDFGRESTETILFRAHEPSLHSDRAPGLEHRG
jgi:hypothetical protein